MMRVTGGGPAIAPPPPSLPFLPPPPAPSSGRATKKIIRMPTTASTASSAARMMSFLSKPISGLAAVTPSGSSGVGNLTLMTLIWSPRSVLKPTEARTSCSMRCISSAERGV